ncbi:hypothetical protein ASD50_21770 [Mesorhizobium sp. Root552]|jgi:hypothetical protein|uniref:hypothetical protein n=1 Tax=Mesorhizobium sp. Root552 TaxID=1736555 RepID=UPI0006F22BAF|nr:hypothetical protein [Mesorhizobium sp. Root552]KQZ20030.1 hypothetical protein ASD50_21770 [Mesorhizobium sp. Root552]
MADDEPDIKDVLAYVAAHPELFTKKEMASLLADAAEVIWTLRNLVDMLKGIKLEDVEPEGNA